MLTFRELWQERKKFTALMIIFGTLVALAIGLNIQILVKIHGTHGLNQRVLSLQRVTTQINRLTQALNLDVHMIANTGNLKWETDYQQLPTQLDILLNDATDKAFNNSLNQAIEKIRSSTEASKSLSNQIVNSVKKGDIRIAQQLLFSDEYDAQQKNISEAIETVDFILLKIQKNELSHSASEATFLSILNVIIFIALIGFWIILEKQSNRSKLDLLVQAKDSAISSQNKLKNYIRSMEQNKKETNDFTFFIANNLKESVGEIKEILESSPSESLSNFIADFEKKIESLEIYTEISKKPLETKLINLKSPLDAALKALIPLIKKEKEQVDIEMPEDWPTINGDPELIKKLFIYLITNAIQFNSSEYKKINIGFRKDTSNQIVVYIKDNGIGIDPKDYDAIFHPYRHLHDPKTYNTGIGVGLSYAKLIVEKQGGKIWLDSVLGQGSTFYFSI